MLYYIVLYIVLFYLQKCPIQLSCKQLFHIRLGLSTDQSRSEHHILSPKNLLLKLHDFRLDGMLYLLLFVSIEDNVGVSAVEASFKN